MDNIMYLIPMGGIQSRYMIIRNWVDNIEKSLDK